MDKQTDRVILLYPDPQQQQQYNNNNKKHNKTTVIVGYNKEDNIYFTVIFWYL